MARRLAKDGMLACTFWRFGAHERFESRVVPWDDFNRQNGGGLDTSQLERGDHLLAFGQSAEVPRYCHHSDDDEVDRLLDACELECFHRFEADGRSGDLNHYAVLRRES
jgi:hypothetical protein